MQTKKMSLIETVSSVIIGFIVALISQLGIFPILGIEVTFSENIILGVFFTIVSIIRGYYVRRFFNWIGNKSKGVGSGI